MEKRRQQFVYFNIDKDYKHHNISILLQWATSYKIKLLLKNEK